MREGGRKAGWLEGRRDEERGGEEEICGGEG